MKKTIFIRKKPGKPKNAIRINTTSDIPENLTKNIRIDGNFLYVVSVEGTEKSNLGSVIGFEKSDKLQTGWNCWIIGNAKENLIEKDGLFFTKPTVFKAEKLSKHLPSFISPSVAEMIDEETWVLQTHFGDIYGKIDESYWVLYKTNEDGSSDVNILSKSEESYKEYVVCNENGYSINLLHVLDPV